MNKIGYGIIGCGHISKRHLSAARKIREIEVVAICDSNPSRLRDAAQELPGVQAFLDYREFLNFTDVNLVSICTPSGHHSRMAIAAAKANKHVILEKPIALTVTDAQRVINNFRDSGKSFCVVLQNRFKPAIRFLREQMPKLGAVRYATAAVFWYRNQDYYNDGWHGSRKLDGGVLMNQALHYVDLLLYLTDKWPEKVCAFGGTYGHNLECEDAITLNIMFSDGILANIQANSFSYPEDFEGSITIFFERATVKIGGKRLDKIEYWKGHCADEAMAYQENQSSQMHSGEHELIISNFADHIQHDEPLLVPGSEGMKSLRLITLAYQSLRTGKAIRT